MSRKFQTGDDGSIFSIGGDGTINRLGKIDNLGNVEGNNRRKSNSVIWGFLIASLITIVILGFQLLEKTRDLNRIEYSHMSEASEHDKQNKDLRIEARNLQSKFDDLRDQFPLKITRIEIGTKDLDGNITYGKTLQSADITYLFPKIYFTNYLKGSRSFNFTINYYDSHGSLVYNRSNGERPTCSATISTSTTEYGMSGWGNASGGSWSPGTYTVEIWSNGVCLGSKRFIIN